MTQSRCPDPENCQLIGDVDHLDTKLTKTNVEVAQYLIAVRVALDRFSDKLEELIREIRYERKTANGRFRKSQDEIPTKKDHTALPPSNTPPPIRKKPQ